MARLLAAFLAIAIAACSGAPAAHAAGQAGPRIEPPPSALLAEVRRSFTVGGKPVPPEIFRDFGDGDLADSGGIWVTVNLLAATGSNLYADDISKDDGGWVTQKKPGKDSSAGEETAYKYIGATANGLLVAVSTFNGGGSGYFTWLHILDLAEARTFDDDGKRTWQVNLTLVRNVPLGDRWGGEVSIAGNAIRIITTRTGPADDSGERRTSTITAERP
jgi:hypothetical protein